MRSIYLNKLTPIERQLGFFSQFKISKEKSSLLLKASPKTKAFTIKA